MNITEEDVRSEAGLHDTVSEILESVPDAELLHVYYEKGGFVVKLRNNSRRLDYWIDSDVVEFSPMNHPRGGKEASRNTHEQYYSKGNLNGKEWGEAVKRIIAEIKNRQSTPEKSLEEKVREILKFVTDFSELKVTDHSVEFLDNSKPPMWYYVKENEIGYAPADSPKSRNTFTVAEYQAAYGSIPEINAVLPKIAALLNDQEDNPSTTYTELEQRVRELEEQLIQERENHIQQGSVEGQKREALEKRVAELEEQLQSSVSEADHEAEIEKWSKAFEGKRNEALNHFRRANKYQRWWETEYAKNAGVSQ